MAGSDLSITCHVSLFEVPPSTMETFCQMMDCSDGDLGWRGLAARLSTDWMEFRKIEKYAEQGKSRTRELLWSWAQKNKTVGDLLMVLHMMGHERAIHLFNSQGASLFLAHDSDRTFNKTNTTFKNCGGQTVEFVSRGTSGSHHKVDRINLPPASFTAIKEGTNNFHQDLLIGEGFFFDIYKAEIQKQMCVVKVLKKKIHSGDKWNLFISQWKSLQRFQHPNIIELLGYFSSDETTCLVYPYLVNGSLYDRIHCTANSASLSWKVRFSILHGVAQAIQYLHNLTYNPVICGNITSKNILLDQHFQPKLSDFAMVHLRSYLINHSYTIKMDQATLSFLGYLPVEYIRRGNLSSKTDVYSYGIIMMEVLTGKPALLKGSENMCLRDLMWDLTEKGGSESLLGILDEKCDSWPQFTAHRLFGLSIECTESRMKQRPDMQEVLKRVETSRCADHSKEDDPKSLKSVPPLDYPSPTQLNYHNVPMESDESLDYPMNMTQIKKPLGNPCECSQSEVTFLGVPRKLEAYRTADNVPSVMERDSLLHSLYIQPRTSHSSRPIECSCASEPDNTRSCEECIANGFGHSDFNAK
ncbi:interleukin-1 receptor-associated kinase 3 isoform X2 [Spea bombifrons]|uniref:interleukin-1 receptor-associated kinase 3 isoform X2 n=1 Tax=Spea bombifrons TaxID=233779 RepID=UPI002349B353|nr:interleukin-1 receptor-associated kinase 3 isoform X2 [Spea bombifrons]